MNAKYIDQDGNEQLLYMGCYGIGVSRTVATIYEENVVNGKNGEPMGISLPISVAPYLLQIVAVDDKKEVAERIYNKLMEAGVPVIIDDRAQGMLGAKIKDCYMFGTPYMLVLGNKAQEGIFEIESTKTDEKIGFFTQDFIQAGNIKLLEEEKIQFQKDKETAERRAEKAEAELKKLEDRREFLQPVMDNVSKEIKEYGMIKTFLPEATALERAVTYRDKKIKPLFIEMKNKIGAMAAQVKELTRERDKWKSKFQKKKQEHENTKKELAEVQKDYQKLSGEKEILQGIADRYNRLLRMLGKDMVERLVQDDIRMQTELEAKKQKEQMPKKISDRIPWAKERSEEHNAQIKKNKAKYRGMEL